MVHIISDHFFHIVHHVFFTIYEPFFEGNLTYSRNIMDHLSTWLVEDRISKSYDIIPYI